MDDKVLLEVESGLSHKIYSGLGNEIHKPVPSNRTDDSLPCKEIVPSALFNFFYFSGKFTNEEKLPVLKIITIFKKSVLGKEG